MKRIAAPMVGGIATSFLLELLVYPAIYAIWRERSLAQQASGSLGLEPALVPEERSPSPRTVPSDHPQSHFAD
jgi:copper/silver efflux system protein